MCGITGVFGKLRAHSLRTVAAEMAATLGHRGPDDQGSWSDLDAGISLAHRRLAILDLSPAGHQPMVSRDERFVVALNGEIYNHLELRSRLEGAAAYHPRRGGKEGSPDWRGHSDTEILLAAIEDWGIAAALGQTVGMFAIALWDRQERCLYLARDRLGEKPLYYGWCGGVFAFGSELKALRALPGFDNAVDRDVLAAYLRLGYVPEPYSIYQGVYKLEPGCLLTLTREGTERCPSSSPLAPWDDGGLHIRRWWSLKEAAQAGQADPLRDEATALDALESRLRAAIRLQSVADVPLGAFLSGGIDSSTIVALMQSESTSPVRTFTVGFDSAAHDEAAHARAVARHLGTDHTELHVTPRDALDVIPRLPAIYDEPFADSSQIPTFLICRQARAGATVALSGDGGDELFGGYNRYLWCRSIGHMLAWLPQPVRAMMAQWTLSQGTDRLDAVCRRLRLHVNTPGDKAHKLAEAIRGVRSLDDLYLGLVSEWKAPASVVLGAREAPTLLARREDWPTSPEVEHRMMYLDAMTYLPGDILCKVDRAAMAVSLETRAPFLDHRVVELAWRLPLKMKIRNGVGKWPLRRILDRYVPRELTERPKQGFAIPLAQWLRGPLREWAEALLDEHRLRDQGYFDPAPIRRRWREHLEGRRNWQSALWSVLMFQSWNEARH